MIDISVTDAQLEIIKSASYSHYVRLRDIRRIDFYRKKERDLSRSLWEVLSVVDSDLGGSDPSKRRIKLNDTEFDLLLEQMLQLNIQTPYIHGNIKALKRYRDVTNLADILWSQLPAGSEHNKYVKPIYDI